MPITEYLHNTGGLNVTDSALTIKDNQATGQSYNYDYAIIGSISKVLAPTVLNTVDTQLKTLGLLVHHSVSTDTRTVVRGAGTSLQTFDPTSGLITTLADDTASAGTSFLNSSSTQPVVGSQFNTLPGGTLLWMAGGGMSQLYGYNGTQITANGVPAPTTSSFTATAVGSGGTLSAGTYRYTLVYRKAITQTSSNASTSTEVSVTTVNNDKVNLAWTLSNGDTTKYDQISVYRSALNGSAGFTTGDLIAQLASSATSYTDSGTSVLSSQVVPRAGGTTDNSQLSTGTYKTVTAFKRRLVTALNSTVYLSDLNKPESWPTSNSITIPTGGPITGLAVVGTTSEYTTGADEYLLVFKETELWAITGASSSDWDLKFIDKTGALSQAVIVPCNGFVAWITTSGVFAYDGRGKPIRISRPINGLFGVDGDLDKTKLSYAWGMHLAKSNQVIWCASHRTKGEQKFYIKLDILLTAPQILSNLEGTEADGVFLLGTESTPMYAGCSYRPSAAEEQFLAGDNAGYVYKMYSSASSAVSFDYETKPLDMGAPHIVKRFKRVIVWTERLTNNDLTLFYWADYRTRDEYRSKVRASLAPLKGTQPALWDVGNWDQASWDDYVIDIAPVEFNLHSSDNNSEGVSLKLRFEQLEAAPCRIHGFAIEWEEVGPISIPTSQVA